jgi:drug/metabolite transporter (DMT)-like permease
MSERRAYALLTAATLFWAGNWIAGRLLADLVPPAALTFWRWAIALALIAPVVGPRLWASRALLACNWRPIVVLGLLGGGLHNVLQYWGLQYTSAINGPILNSLTPIFIIVLGALLLREPFPRRAAAGAIVALAGALAIVTRLDFQVVRNLSFNAGDLLIILSLLMLAGYTLALRWRPKGLDALSFLACFALVAEIPVGMLYAFEYASGKRIVLNASSLAGLAYVAIFPALLSYHFWNLGVAAIGAARAGVFMYLLPFFGSMLGVGLLGERFGVHHAAGMALIISGVFIATRRAAGQV